MHQSLPSIRTTSEVIVETKLLLFIFLKNLNCLSLYKTRGTECCTVMQGHSCSHIAFQNRKACDYNTVFNMSTSAQRRGRALSFVSASGPCPETTWVTMAPHYPSLLVRAQRDHLCGAHTSQISKQRNEYFLFSIMLN